MIEGYPSNAEKEFTPDSSDKNLTVFSKEKLDIQMVRKLGLACDILSQWAYEKKIADKTEKCLAVQRAHIKVFSPPSGIINSMAKV
ncbi:hypothetical protein TNCV_3514491 [Trichonephila clavipes]|nr:hypothetical protein TNCV_3514491 [Trichonephila clavipes]